MKKDNCWSEQSPEVNPSNRVFFGATRYINDTFSCYMTRNIFAQCSISTTVISIYMYHICPPPQITLIRFFSLSNFQNCQYLKWIKIDTLYIWFLHLNSSNNGLVAQSIVLMKWWKCHNFPSIQVLFRRVVWVLTLAQWIILNSTLHEWFM